MCEPGVVTGRAGLTPNDGPHGLTEIARQQRRPESTGTLPSDTVQFDVLVGATALLVGALSFLPAPVLGPTVEHLRLRASTHHPRRRRREPRPWPLPRTGCGP